MAGAALHEQRDHRPRLRLEVRRLRRQIEAALLQLGASGCAEQLLLVEQPGEREAAEAQRALGEEVAAREIAGMVVHG